MPTTHRDHGNHYYPHEEGVKWLQVGMIGGGGVGKTALALMYTCGEFRDDCYDPTAFDYYEAKETIDGKNIVIEVLDAIGSQEEYSALRDMLPRKSEVFIVVYDITNRASFDEIHHVIERSLRVREDAPAPLVLCGNKADLRDKRQVTEEEGVECARSLGCPFLETSAKMFINVRELFGTAAQCYFNNSNDNSGKKKKSKCIIC